VKRMRISIRLRLTLWYAAVLLVGLFLFGSGLWFAVEHRLVAAVDGQLAQYVEGVRKVAEIEGPNATQADINEEMSEFVREVPHDALVEVRETRDGRLLALTGPPALAEFPPIPAGAAPRYSDIAVRGRPYRLIAKRIAYGGRTYDVHVAVSLEEMGDMLRVFRELLLLAAPLVMLIAGCGGYWISTRALAPVDRITLAARSIGIQNLSERLRAPDTGDELERLARTWNDMLGRLEAAVKRIAQFTADASHELRTPVTLMRTTAELALRRERDPEQYRTALREIVEETERMSQLIDDLLALARADAGGSLAMTGTDLADLVARIVRQSGSIAEARRIRLSLETGAPAMILANEPALRRLVLVLIDNALKHTLAGGAVYVSLRDDGRRIALEVADTGDGIDAADLPHIFERFYRSARARAGDGGFGLGLSIAQTIAQAHGANIEAHSAAGQGASFTVTFPKAGADAITAEARARQNASSPGTG
jgi:two-component system, OmpR family, heavy metal sensor histidine kinase CusS